MRDEVLERLVPLVFTLDERMREGETGVGGLTDMMKKSRWRTLTMPKLVYLNRLSITHMMFGKICLRGLKVDISSGTSPVDWWLAITRVRSSMHFVMSSPISTTGRRERVRSYRLRQL